ncbi:PTS system, Lactose/Cellobiose specific IIA subunit [Alkalibacterium gilvum]|uniref:PTS system, Lactose/Cellobiose specific IIA subunit n=1 Tax=Alkalibacterium gilvum TaxID=1130080 RepID=A0A1H6RUP4_9LACT|nr:PTS system, Lactose/Cellobiose specific IIA subunit [Alkalibacterium gilvum]
MEEMELIFFEIISTVGTARSAFIDAIGLAKKGDFKAAEAKINEGNEHFYKDINRTQN